MHQLEVVQVESRREGIDESALFIERVGKGVRASWRDDDIVARFGVNGFAVLQMEADRAFGDQECLVMLFTVQSIICERGYRGVERSASPTISCQ